MDLKTCYRKVASHKIPHFISFHLYGMSKVGKSIGTEKSLTTARGWGEMGRGRSDCYW